MRETLARAPASFRSRSSLDQRARPAVVTAAGWTERQQQVLHHDRPRTEIEYRLAWTRTYLKMMGLVTNSSCGVWAVTELGRATTEPEIEVLRREAAAARQTERRDRRHPKDLTSTPATGDDTISNPDDDPDTDSGATGWQDGLLETLLALTPDAFERLAQRLLREAGFL